MIAIVMVAVAVAVACVTLRGKARTGELEAMLEASAERDYVYRRFSETPPNTAPRHEGERYVAGA